MCYGSFVKHPGLPPVKALPKAPAKANRDGGSGSGSYFTGDAKDRSRSSHSQQD